MRSFFLLGPLRVLNGVELLPLPLGRRERAVLTLLALHGGHRVTTTKLVDELWPQEPPAAAANTVQVYVSRIRRALGRELVLTDPLGYRLAITSDDVDVSRFDALATRGERALRGGRYAEATGVLAEALALWTGDALVDGLELPAVHVEAVRLAERRLCALEDRAEAELALGRGPDLVSELQALTKATPLRERLQGALMTALFHAGRQSEALQVYAEHRAACIDQLGMEPGPALRRLHRSILAGGHDLAPAATTHSSLTTLGSASSVPQPPTSLVGRRGEIAELTGLLTTPPARLITLTGPGGTGKTRLAVEVARQLVEAFPDGVYFVSLAAVTTAEVMWTTIAEVMDVPPEGRSRSAFPQHVAHRSALFVLDNLEQLNAADEVIAQLLAMAPQVVVVATSRRPLRVTGQFEYPVRPLDLPARRVLEQASGSGAVQLFVQHARMVRPGFVLDDSNVGQVVEVCERLDGLPLAIELAAARSKVLSPKALLARIEDALELTDAAVDRPSRHQTLRATIDWSYHLLDEDQQAFFRRLAVFAGGADLDGVTAVLHVSGRPACDPLQTVHDLLDTSLLTVAENAQGEPRVDMLQTVRSYARDLLCTVGELDQVSRVHACHFLDLLQRMRASFTAGDEPLMAAQRWFEQEHDNIREALVWSLGATGSPAPTGPQLKLGLELCANLGRWWQHGGYVAEGQRWLTLAISRAEQHESAELADCLNWLAEFLLLGGDLDRALEAAAQSVVIWRRLGDQRRLGRALIRLAQVRLISLDRTGARLVLQEAVRSARATDDLPVLANGLSYLADLEAAEGDFELSIELQSQAMDLHLEIGDEYNALTDRHGIACTLREMGRLAEAREQLRDSIPRGLKLYEPAALMVLCEDYAAVLSELGQAGTAARLLGAADAMRDLRQTPRDPAQEAEIAGPMALARAALPPETWDREYQHGRRQTVPEALTDAD